MTNARRWCSLLAMLVLGCVNEPDAPATAHLDQTTVMTPGPFAGVLRAQDPAIANLSPASRLALTQAPFRMLVLPPEYAATSTVMSDARWAAVSHRDATLSISLHATNLWHDGATDEDIAAMPQTTGSVHGHPAWETENESIQSISWNEHDVAFALEVECDDPVGDPRCQSGTFVADLANRLVYAQDEVVR